MKRYLTLIFCLMLVVMSLAACGGKNTAVEPEEEAVEELSEAEKIAEVDEDKLEKAGNTLEDRLSLLKKDGWKKKDDAYVYTSNEDDVKGEFSIKASGNDADLTVSLDYGEDNGEMVDYFKEEKGTGQAICAYWYLRAVAVLDAPLGTVTYRLSVGDSEVVSGSMTYEEAEEIYDQYYED